MKRRTFLELTGFGIAGASCSCGMLSENSTSRPMRPNFVLIMADDLGWADVGYHDSLIHTPNIDRMAHDGVELDKFYVYPVGTPTRASLMTGRFASRLGIISQLGISGDPPLAYGQETLASLLRRAGYDTAITGKWNLGNELSSAPDRYGFNHSHGFLGPWIDSYSHRTAGNRIAWYRNGEFIEQRGHATDLIADEAVDFIRNEDYRDKTKPFFLYVAFNAPHLPLQEDNNQLRRYRDMFVNESRRYYAAMVTHMDDAIGRILDELVRQGLDNDTLVIFISDNGAEPPGRKDYIDIISTINTTADTAMYGNNAPLSSGKYTLYEGGIRVPALLYWPGTLQSRKVMDSVAVYDITPTILSQADVRIHPETIFNGIDIFPVVTGANELPERSCYLRIGSALSVSINGWKLIHIGGTPDKGLDELYNIDQDPSEKYNQADIDTAIRDALKRELERQYTLDETAREALLR